MTATDYRETLRLLDAAIGLFSRPDPAPPERLRRKLRQLSRDFDLLRARLGQPCASLRRN